MLKHTVFFFLLVSAATQGQQVQDGPQKPLQVLWKMGPVKIGVVYKESKLVDRLKLSKAEANFFFANNRGSPKIQIGKIIHREDLIRCGNFLTNKPEMESLIDCKPIEEQVLDVQPTEEQRDPTMNYVKRTKLVLENALDFLPSYDDGESREEMQFYPFKADFTEQSVKKVLKQHDMKQGLGFDPSAPTWGFFVNHANCSANLFISINQSDPIPTRGSENAIDDAAGNEQPEVFFNFKHLMNEVKRNGGFLSLQEIFCETDFVSINFESDFTLIYRKQFPFLTLTHNLVTEPFTDLWSYSATIKQTKLEGETMTDDAYNTSVLIRSNSTGLNELNFNLERNFSNLNSATGFEDSLLIHPDVLGFIRSTWSENSLERFLTAIPMYPYIDWKDPATARHGIIYSDKPENAYVALSFVVDREMLQNFLSKLIYSEEEKDEDVDLRAIIASVDAAMPHLREAIIKFAINKLEHDEL